MSELMFCEPMEIAIELAPLAGSHAGSYVEVTVPEFDPTWETIDQWSFSAGATVARGQRLAVGVLVVSGATMPTLVGNSGNAGSSELAIAPRLCGLVTGQTDLPTSVAAGSVSNSGASQAYARVA